MFLLFKILTLSNTFKSHITNQSSGCKLRTVYFCVRLHRERMKQLIALATVLLAGCVSIGSLPQSAAEVDFNPAMEGRTGWSKYEEVFVLKGTDTRTAYLAAKAGLSDAGFTIKRASFEKLFAIGEHGITAYDWNIVARCLY